ncbi:hypothetical protein [Aureimonas glaciei]|uniref:Uncharacterized protein n=1 Tax=Aureimonas glaciei TaxID=1776957 RepID=A0A916YE80_9HYPH|nr:hypothetical protein [Aureimonas glaciei]GGD41819.1 hypothetical protein GCM10011335_50640 [Aureimonas glaciei]
MSKWIPDRKVWAGGLTMIAAWLLVQALNVYVGADIPIEASTVLAFGIGKAVEYLVPQPAKELIAKIDDSLVSLAGQSPESAVTVAVGAAATTAMVKELMAPAANDFDTMMARITAKGS